MAYPVPTDHYGLFHGPGFPPRQPVNEPDPWEAWVKEFPLFYEDDEAEGCANQWTRDVRDWFRRMPRGKQ